MKKFSIIIGFLLIGAGLAAQNFYDFKGVGARAAGMAFAFNAVADDATAISWNPAGLTQLKKPELSLLQRIGLSPAQVLATSTSNFSDAFNWNIGKIKPGFVADILILNDNPLNNLENLKNINAKNNKGLSDPIGQRHGYGCS